MRGIRHTVLCALFLLAVLLSSCGDSDAPLPPQTYSMGDRVVLGNIVYVVYETQWLTHLGEGVDARVPRNRFFLVRLSAVNSSNREITVPNFKVEDDNGTVYPELGGDQAGGVPQYIGYLRRVAPANSVQGHALFDAPPRHYKLRLMDEDGEKTAFVDIPLSFTSESPDVPQVGKKETDPSTPLRK